MAVSSNTSWNLTYEEIIQQAMQRAGVLAAGQQPSGDEKIMGGAWLNAGLKEWQAAGRLLRQVERTTTTLTSGTAAYTLASTTIDVEFPIMVVNATSGNESIVERMTLAQYMEITDKTQTGTPTRALIERQASTVLTLWPVPDTTVTTLKYARVKIMPDMDAGTNPDVFPRMLKAVVAMLALDFAEHFGKSADKIERLERRFETAKREVFRENAERGDVTFYLD